MLANTQRTPAEPAEQALPRRILALTPFVVPAVELHDEPYLGAGEVDDEVPDDELPAEGEPSLRAREPAPDPFLGARGLKLMRRARSSRS